MFKLIQIIFITALSLNAQAHDLNIPPAIASAHPLATQVGYDILKKGGNAFDAAVAVSSTLAVVEPYASGLGGGGFWLLHTASNDQDIMIDGRETAPLVATRDMYLDKNGEVIPRLSLDGAKAAAIPGEPAALVYLAEHYGKLTLAEDLAPAIKLAREGFAVNDVYVHLAGMRLQTLKQNPAASKLFLKNNTVPKPGDIIKQPELAKTLMSIAKNGKAGFYQGEVAKNLVKAVRDGGGIWSLQDLKNYQVKTRTPIKSFYNGMLITSAPPPSSGGVALTTMLNILSNYKLDELSPVEQKHLIIEAMRRAYWDRAKFLGDSDFVEVPVKALTSMAHAKTLAKTIDKHQATASATLGKITMLGDNGTDTTHFSIIDKDGNRVAATMSINYFFGSGFVAAGTGVLLNDEMDDFVMKPGTPNIFGLVGGRANEITSGKRPLSSMSPTFVETQNKVAILGTPGGSRIISMILLAILDMEQGHGPKSWVSLPRYHHQYLPDTVQLEPNAIAENEKQALRKMGHNFKQFSSPYGNMQAVLWDRVKNSTVAASDRRRLIIE